MARSLLSIPIDFLSPPLGPTIISKLHPIHHYEPDGAATIFGSDILWLVHVVVHIWVHMVVYVMDNVLIASLFPQIW